MPRERAKEVHALSQKLDSMVEVLVEKQKIKRNSLSDLASYCGIKYDTLKVTRTKGRVSRTTETKLSKALEFETENPVWVDNDISPTRRSQAEGQNYFGRDTASEFRYMLRTQHDLCAVQFTRVESRRPDHLDENLARLSISDSGQQTAFDQALQIFFSIIMEPGYHEGMYYGFCRIRLRFLTSEQIRFEERLASQAEIQLAGAILSVRGGSHSPEWLLTVKENTLEGEYLCPDPLCHVAGGKIGDHFTAELSVRPEDGSLRSIGNRKFPSKLKRVIIERLYEKRLKQSVDSQGWLSLGRQELRIVRADQL